MLVISRNNSTLLIAYAHMPVKSVQFSMTAVLLSITGFCFILGELMQILNQGCNNLLFSNDFITPLIAFKYLKVNLLLFRFYVVTHD